MSLVLRDKGLIKTYNEWRDNGSYIAVDNDYSISFDQDVIYKEGSKNKFGTLYLRLKAPTNTGYIANRRSVGKIEVTYSKFYDKNGQEVNVNFVCGNFTTPKRFDNNTNSAVNFDDIYLSATYIDRAFAYGNVTIKISDNGDIRGTIRTAAEINLEIHGEDYVCKSGENIVINFNPTFSEGGYNYCVGQYNISILAGKYLLGNKGFSLYDDNNGGNPLVIKQLTTSIVNNKKRYTYSRALKNSNTSSLNITVTILGSGQTVSSTNFKYLKSFSSYFNIPILHGYYNDTNDKIILNKIEDFPLSLNNLRLKDKNDNNINGSSIDYTGGNITVELPNLNNYLYDYLYLKYNDYYYMYIYIDNFDKTYIIPDFTINLANYFFYNGQKFNENIYELIDSVNKENSNYFKNKYTGATLSPSAKVKLYDDNDNFYNEIDYESFEWPAQSQPTKLQIIYTIGNIYKESSIVFQNVSIVNKPIINYPKIEENNGIKTLKGETDNFGLDNYTLKGNVINLTPKIIFSKNNENKEENNITLTVTNKEINGSISHPTSIDDTATQLKLVLNYTLSEQGGQQRTHIYQFIYPLSYEVIGLPTILYGQNQLGVNVSTLNSDEVIRVKANGTKVKVVLDGITISGLTLSTQDIINVLSAQDIVNILNSGNVIFSGGTWNTSS